MDYKNIIKLEKVEKKTNKEFNSYEELTEFINKNKNNNFKKCIKEDVYQYFLDNEYKLFDIIINIKKRYNILDLLENKNLSYITHIFIKNSTIELIENDEEEIEYDEEN